MEQLHRPPGVDEVEGRYVVNIRAREGQQPWHNLGLAAIDDFEGSTINRLVVIEGVRTPGDNQVVVSQDFRHDTGFQVGDERLRFENHRILPAHRGQ